MQAALPLADCEMYIIAMEGTVNNFSETYI